MTSSIIWLVIIAIVPILGIYLLGANAALIFLSLCLGYVLYSFDSHNAADLAHSLNSHSELHLKASAILVNLLLLLGPAVITLIAQIRSVHGSKHLFNLIPAVFCGLFAALLIVPLLPATLASGIVRTLYWEKLSRYQAEVVGAGAAVSLIFFWLTHNHQHSEKKHHKSKS